MKDDMGAITIRQNDTDLETALLKQSMINLNEKMEPNKIAEIIYLKIKAIS
jgi:hypothetical protein